MNRLTRPHHAIPGLSTPHRLAKTVCVPLVAINGNSYRLKNRLQAIERDIDVA